MPGIRIAWLYWAGNSTLSHSEVYRLQWTWISYFVNHKISKDKMNCDLSFFACSSNEHSFLVIICLSLCSLLYTVTMIFLTRILMISHHQVLVSLGTYMLWDFLSHLIPSYWASGSGIPSPCRQSTDAFSSPLSTYCLSMAIYVS